MSDEDEISYGVIPIAIDVAGMISACMVQHRRGRHWGFPKGHCDGDETPRQTAERELLEETGLRITRWLPFDPIEERYTFVRDGVRRKKRVVYFYCLISEKQPLPQTTAPSDEVQESLFVPIDALHEKATFSEMKRLMRRVVETVRSRKEIPSRSHEGD